MYVLHVGIVHDCVIIFIPRVCARDNAIGFGICYYCRCLCQHARSRDLDVRMSHNCYQNVVDVKKVTYAEVQPAASYIVHMGYVL